MTNYYATFISGTQEVVLRQLKKQPLDQLKVHYIDDGLVVFSSVFLPARIVDFRFFNNTFLLLKDFGAKPENSLEAMAAALLSGKLPASEELAKLTTGKTLKLAASEENQPVRLASHHTLEQHLIKQLPVGSGNVVQFELALRRNGKGLFGLRLSKPLFKRLKRPAGALRPELVNILCLVANTASKDTVLDPFAGYGSVIDECLQGFHVRQVVAVEKDDNLFNQLNHSYKSDKVQLVHGSAANLTFLDDGSVTKIITDPPWGIYGNMKQQELLDLYWQSLTEIARVIKPGGVLVLLSGNSDLNKMAEAVKQLELVKTYNVLVSGKKASIIKLRKSDKTA